MMRVLRSYIRTILSERKGPSSSAFFSDKGPGTAWDEEEEKAKQEYEALKSFEELWTTENEKYERYFKGKTAAQKRKFSEENPDITLNWPTWPGQEKVADYQAGNQVRKAVEKSLENYKQYDAEAGGGKLQYTAKSGAKTEADKELPPSNKKVYQRIEDVDVGVWLRWPDVVLKSGIKYGSKSKKSGDDSGGAASGVGPGEDWLSFLFGGQTQGASVSFDVVTQDGRTWEVKAIEELTDTIRPGTHGLKVFEKPKQRLISVIRQLKNFCIVAKNLGFLEEDSFFNEQQKNVILYARDFLNIEREMLIDKGEISNERFLRLRGALKKIAKLKLEIEKSQKISDPESFKTKIGLNKKSYEVDKRTYIDIARKVSKSSKQEVDIPDYEILLSTLKDPVFENPTTFINEFFDSVKPAAVFSQTSGIFIVTPTHYMMIPKDEMSQYLKFVKVTQGKPRFAVGQGGNQENEQQSEE